MKCFRMSKSRATIAMAALLVLCAVSAVRLSGVGQAQESPTPKQQSEKDEEKQPEKETKAEAEETTEKAPVKGEENAPVKGEEKAPGTREKKEPKVPGVRPPRKTVPAIPGLKAEMENPKEPGPAQGRPRSDVDKKGPNPGKQPEGRPRKLMPKTGAEVEKAAIDGLPDDFSDQQRQIYRNLEDPEITFEEYYEHATQEFLRLRELERNPALRYQPGRGQKVLGPQKYHCGNGDFEPGLDAAEWSGAYGTGDWYVPTPTTLTSGILPGNGSGPITSPTSRQTLVNASDGPDPYVGISMTGPNTNVPTGISPNAMRIGNAANGWGTELLSKTFSVSSSDTQLRFWYAVVMENPLDHAVDRQPFFEVRVLAGGVAIPGLVNLGNGSSRLVADSANPFFQVLPGADRPDAPLDPLAAELEPIVFKDWSCAQIDLSQQVGKTVTVEFVTQDCGAGGHWAYAYIDDICGTCLNSPTGDLTFDPGTSSACGPGQICFNYTLPHTQNAAGNITGTGVITLDIYQGGQLITSLPPSPTLTTGTSYCFPITATTLSGISSGGAGFDFVSTGTFTLGSNVQVLTVGTVPNGRVAGPNNDYALKCVDKPPAAQGCCLGENLVRNGDFELDGPRPESEYIRGDVGPDLVPGKYAVTDVDAIGKACRSWLLPKACNGTRDFAGHVMLVNGLTSQIAPAAATAVIWQQKLDLPSGDKKAQYRVCFRYLPLPACCFDIVAKPSLVVDGDGAIVSGSEQDVDTGCGHLYSATVEAYGPINLQIVLPQDGMGDGNDLLIDNISMAKLVNVPLAALLFTLQAAPGTGGNYDVTLTAPAGLTNPVFTWVWEMWDPVTNTIITSVSGNMPTVTFPNLLASTSYVFKLKAWSDCNTLSGTKQTWSFEPTAKKAPGRTVEDPNPEPVAIPRNIIREQNVQENDVLPGKPKRRAE